ncbi:MAG: ATP-binding cassette domain-containing protein [Actinomycetota bacterium]
MGDLVITDLIVEYDAGPHVVRPIDGLNVTVASGNLTLLLGPSGCGKSTLLSCLGSILEPTSGSITMDGQEITGLDQNGLIDHRRRRVGIVFQSFNLVDSLTAIENVALPMRNAGVSGRDAKARAIELLTEVGLEERLKHRPGELSGGQQQRVAIARALALDPPFLLADEPTAHLDYIQVEGILRLLRRLADAGRTIIISTHDERILPLADQVIEMQPKFASGFDGEHEPIERTLDAGDVLFAQGDAPDDIYVVESGALEVVRTAASGEAVVVAQVGTGEFVGEMGPLFGLPRSATVRATETTTVIAHSPASFRDTIGVDSLNDVIAGRGSA